MPQRASALAIDSADNLYVAVSAATDNSDRVVKPGQMLKLTPDG